MNYPIQISKILGLLLFLLLFFFSSALSVRAAGEVTLTEMRKTERIDQTRITFLFSQLPEFDVEHSGQRVDLLLKNVWLSTKIRKLPEDETVVKILLAQKYRDLLASLLLRRTPKEIHTEAKNDPPRIELDLYWQGDSAARPGVAFRIADMPPRKAGKKARELQQESPWNGRWRDFYREYRTYPKLSLPFRYSLPKLPPAIFDGESPVWPLQRFADEGKWLSLLRRAGELEADFSDKQKAQLSMLVAEAQLRTDAIEAALVRLETLKDQQRGEPVRVGYLTAYAQALSNQPFIALLTLQELLPTLEPGKALTPLCYLLAAEAAVASKQYKQALEYLQNPDLKWPAALLSVVDLRRADALAGTGDHAAAVALYQDLEAEPELFEHYLFSTGQAALSAYKIDFYPMASRLYRLLAEQLKDGPGKNLVQFFAGATTYAAGDLEWGVINLQKAALDWPGTEGGDRAELRLIDHQLISGDEFELAKAAVAYGQLSKSSGVRLVREESAFKRALALYLLADHYESVRELMVFRREFGSSKLRRETDLLLLEQLPQVVHSLLKQQRELDAVVLVEQNRELLLRGGFDRAFLHDLATSFKNLGLYARAGRVLLFLFDKAADEQQRKALYLPLARSYLLRDEFGKASDYASRYLKKYPAGADSAALFGVLLDAFAKQGRDEELLTWLERDDRPSSSALEVRAAWIYWDMGRLREVTRSLKKAMNEQKSLSVKEMALLGEAHYQLQENSAAEKIYRQLVDDPLFGSQACYRLAQIFLREEQKRSALNLLEKLVDEDGNSSWGKLAQDLLIQEKTRKF